MVLSLAVLGATAIVQAVVFVGSGSVALLADLIHNGGDALTAVPLGIAFPHALATRRRLRGPRRRRRDLHLRPGRRRRVDPPPHRSQPADRPHPPRRRRRDRLPGQLVAARIRTRAGERLPVPGPDRRRQSRPADAYVSLAVVAAAAAVAAGAPILDPIIGILITIAILRITWASWRTVRHDVRGATHHHH